MRLGKLDEQHVFLLICESVCGLIPEDVTQDQIGSVHILNVVVDRVGLEVDPEVFEQRSEQAATSILIVVGPE